ncbi:MAG: mannose-1-phosphate guanyltransferase [Caldilineae bacterium]|nr:MAG: mannose-1-phosphate guanyltransferase [Caldilineae bacterium]
MTNNPLYTLILAGGVGSRLWPKSRTAHPKQFLNLTGDETMLQTAVRRIAPLIPPERIFVATGERYVPLVRAQLPTLPPANIIAEISGKNTAPAIGLGALHIARANPQATMVVLTADHLIPDETTFRAALQVAAEVAQTGKLVTLGIAPTGPETGYGYIHRGAELGRFGGQTVYAVSRFLEKPNLATARRFIASGEYYWNSGMFIWQVGALFDALSRHMPALWGQLRQLRTALFDTPNGGGDLPGIWAQIEPQSIDFGLMEKADNVAVVPLDAGWNDVGSWAALYGELAPTGRENVVINAQHLALDSEGLLIQGNGKLVATIGLRNLAIIQTDDALLICPLERTQDVKKLVEQLKAQNRHQYL